MRPGWVDGRVVIQGALASLLLRGVDGLNLYRYVRNNPVNLVDPDGMSPDPPVNPIGQTLNLPSGAVVTGYYEGGKSYQISTGTINPLVGSVRSYELEDGTSYRAKYNKRGEFVRYGIAEANADQTVERYGYNGSYKNWKDEYKLVEEGSFQQQYDAWSEQFRADFDAWTFAQDEEQKRLDALERLYIFLLLFTSISEVMGPGGAAKIGSMRFSSPRTGKFGAPPKMSQQSIEQGRIVGRGNKLRTPTKPESAKSRNIQQDDAFEEFIGNGVRSKDMPPRVAERSLNSINTRLAFEEKSLLFTKEGLPTSKVIDNANIAIKGDQLKNQKLITALTKDGSVIDDWNKMTYVHKFTENGVNKSFDIHFYYNSKTKNLYTEFDYKSKLSKDYLKQTAPPFKHISPTGK